MNRIKIFLTTVFAFLSLLTFAQQDQSSSISMEQFKMKLKTEKDLIVLDVRTPEELAGPLGKIDNVINIPIQNLEQRIDELKSYKDKEIVVICRTQNRSAVAANILLKNGYNAKYVLGGMVEFRK